MSSLLYGHSLIISNHCRTLDYDFQPDHMYEFQLTAVDGGTPARSGSAKVQVFTNNVNDEEPVFLPERQALRVKEGASSSLGAIHVVLAFDPDGDRMSFEFDINDNTATGGKKYYVNLIMYHALLYSNVSFPSIILVNTILYLSTACNQGTNSRETCGIFVLDGTSGEITLNQVVGKGQNDLELSVNAIDDGSCCGGNGGTGRTSNGKVAVSFMGVNHPPRFPICGSIQASVSEGISPNSTVVQVTI